MEFVALIVLFTLALSNNVALKVADFLGESFDIRDMSCFLKLLNPFSFPDVVSLAVGSALFIHSPLFMNCEKYIGSLSCSYPDCDGRLGLACPLFSPKILIRWEYSSKSCVVAYRLVV